MLACLARELPPTRFEHLHRERAANEIWLEHGEPVPDREVRRTARVGVAYAGAWARRRYRFVVETG